MKKILIIFFIGYVSAGLSQNKIIFKDGKSIDLSVLNNQLIEVVGESNYRFSKSFNDKFSLCFFSKIASNSSYKVYQEDIIKSKNYSKNKDERMYFLYKIKYINSALWSCAGENSKMLEEMSRIDKIIPQSEEKIKAFAEVHLEDLKKEIGTSQYIDLGKIYNLERYSKCFMRKLWMNFTPKEMYENSSQTQNKVYKFMETCLEDNLK